VFSARLAHPGQILELLRGYVIEFDLYRFCSEVPWNLGVEGYSSCMNRDRAIHAQIGSACLNSARITPRSLASDRFACALGDKAPTTSPVLTPQRQSYHLIAAADA
jgi:hypothetical protein